MFLLKVLKKYIKTTDNCHCKDNLVVIKVCVAFRKSLVQIVTMLVKIYEREPTCLSKTLHILSLVSIAIFQIVLFDKILGYYFKNSIILCLEILLSPLFA